MEHKEEFRYTYSAAQQAEIEKIRSKYTQPRQDKMSLLRQLDRSASQKAQTWALVVGILGSLVMGTGMSLAMTQLGARMGVWAMPVGIVVGLGGIILVALAYPIYNRILQRERKRIAPQILQLAEELLQ